MSYSLIENNKFDSYINMAFGTETDWNFFKNNYEKNNVIDEK